MSAPPRLRELQAALVAGLLNGDTESLRDLVAGDGLGAHARLQIHRNHTFITLREALAATYPVVCRLVGEEFFAALARAYVAVHPPTRPCLFEYGPDFGDFIASFEPARPVPYLADVARFEWALNEAYHAPTLPPLEASGLVALASGEPAELHLTVQPSLRIVRSPYPVNLIWAANQSGMGEPEAVDLGEGGSAFLIHRKGDAVAFLRIGAGDAALLSALAAGSSLGPAAEAALAAQPSHDLAAALRLILSRALAGEQGKI